MVRVLLVPLLRVLLVPLLRVLVPQLRVLVLLALLLLLLLLQLAVLAVAVTDAGHACDGWFPSRVLRVCVCVPACLCVAVRLWPYACVVVRAGKNRHFGCDGTRVHDVSLLARCVVCGVVVLARWW